MDMELVPERERTKPSWESRGKLRHGSGNLGNKVQSGRTGHSSGWALGSQAGGSHDSGSCTHMLQNPCQKAVFGQNSSSWSGGLTGARGVQVLARCTVFQNGLWSRGGDDCLCRTICKPRRTRLGRCEIMWPRPILGVVLWHEFLRKPGLTLEFQCLDLRGSKGYL